MKEWLLRSNLGKGFLLNPISSDYVIELPVEVIHPIFYVDKPSLISVLANIYSDKDIRLFIYGYLGVDDKGRVIAHPVEGYYFTDWLKFIINENADKIESPVFKIFKEIYKEGYKERLKEIMILKRINLLDYSLREPVEVEGTIGISGYDIFYNQILQLIDNQAYYLTLPNGKVIFRRLLQKAVELLFKNRLITFSGYKIASLLDDFETKYNFYKFSVKTKTVESSGRTVITPDLSIKLGQVSVPYSFIIEFLIPFLLESTLVKKYPELEKKLLSRKYDKLKGLASNNEIKAVCNLLGIDEKEVRKDVILLQEAIAKLTKKLQEILNKYQTMKSLIESYLKAGTLETIKIAGLSEEDKKKMIELYKQIENYKKELKLSQENIENNIISLANQKGYEIDKEILEDFYIRYKKGYYAIKDAILIRQPTLWKHNLQVYEIVPSENKTIGLYPLYTAGFGADFDGDTMAIFTLFDKRDVNKLNYEKNLKTALGDLVYRWTHEWTSALYLLDLYELYELIKIIYPEFQFPIFSVRYKYYKYIENDINNIEDKELRDILLKLVFYSNQKALDSLMNYLISRKEYDKIEKITKFLANKVGKITFDIEELKQLNEEVKNYVKQKYNISLEELIELDFEKYNEILLDIRKFISEEIANKIGKYKNTAGMVLSGARANVDNIAQFTSPLGYIQKANGLFVDVPINSNYLEGLKSMEYFILTHKVRFSLGNGKLNIGKATRLSLQLMIMANKKFEIVDKDCGATEGLPSNLINREEIKYRNYLEKGFFVRSPIFCNYNDEGKVCSACYGDYPKINKYDIAQIFAEKLVNSLFKLKHSASLVASKSWIYNLLVKEDQLELYKRYVKPSLSFYKIIEYKQYRKVEGYLEGYLEVGKIYDYTKLFQPSNLISAIERILNGSSILPVRVLNLFYEGISLGELMSFLKNILILKHYKENYYVFDVESSFKLYEEITPIGWTDYRTLFDIFSPDYTYDIKVRMFKEFKSIVSEFANVRDIILELVLATALRNNYAGIRNQIVLAHIDKDEDGYYVDGDILSLGEPAYLQVIALIGRVKFKKWY